MSSMTRREFLVLAASFGATLAWPGNLTAGSQTGWKERRDLYPHGVASGDPYADSVILWTRRPPASGLEAHKLTLELSEYADFRHIVATSLGKIGSESDWTCRVLAAGLKPGRVYWYRFTDEHGFGSRVGRTITAPAENDGRAVQFAFVSCQNVQQGACNAYRRMIWEDERRPAADQLGFVLHLGDFVYEVVWYPEDRPQGMYARHLRDIVRYESGEKHADFHVPTTVDDYRSLYRAYLLDPDLQDARARWPFICMWDNHEFSWKGWQSQQNFGNGVLPAQTRKVAASQAWFEYQPARVIKPGKAGLDQFTAPAVADTPIRDFDQNGMGQEPGNLAAVNCLKLYRTLRWGRHVDLLLTDNRSYRSEPLADRSEFAPFKARGFPGVYARDVLEILDAGSSYNNGQPPATIRFNGADLPNPRRNAPPQSMLGSTQKEWFLNQLRKPTASWKLWGNTVAMLDWNIDFQNLPLELGLRWPSAGYAQFIDDDWSGYRFERNEVLDFIHREKIANFACLSGDRHAFQAGVLSTKLSPKDLRPVAAEFVTGSVSAPGLLEGMEYGLPADHPLRAVFLQKSGHNAPVQATMNLAMLHGVRAALALEKTGDVSAAVAERNPGVAPHLSFTDAGGHGYTMVRASANELDVEFVCVPRPIERSAAADGGPLAYRIAHRVKPWKAGNAPRLERTRTEGKLPLGM
jgi:alkaline phosphatase D